MNQPSQLLRRARQQRARSLPDRRDFRPPAPAPAPAAIPPRPAPAPQATNAVIPPAEPAPQRVARPTGHALYSEIMKSHDRMGTRHL